MLVMPTDSLEMRRYEREHAEELRQHEEELCSADAAASMARLPPGVAEPAAGVSTSSTSQTELARPCDSGEDPLESAPAQINRGKRLRDTAGPNSPRAAKRLGTAAPTCAVVPGGGGGSSSSAQGRLQAEGGLLPAPIPLSPATFCSPPAAPRSARFSGHAPAALVSAPTRTPPGVLVTRTPPGVTMGMKAGTAVTASSGASMEVAASTPDLPASRQWLPPPGVTARSATSPPGPVPFLSPNGLAALNPAQPQLHVQAQPRTRFVPGPWPQQPDPAQAHARMAPGPRWPQPPQWHQQPPLPGLAPVPFMVNGGQTRAARLPIQTQPGLSIAPSGRPGGEGRGVGGVGVRFSSNSGGGAKALREQLKRRLSSEKKKREEQAGAA